LPDWTNEYDVEYQRRYRQDHPNYVDQNRRAQRHRDRKRKLANLVENNLAISEVAISSRLPLPSCGRRDLVKNIHLLQSWQGRYTDGHQRNTPRWSWIPAG
jgi:hypothetical protein